MYYTLIKCNTNLNYVLYYYYGLRSINVLPFVFHPVDTDSPQLSPFNTKGPLCLSPSFQMSTLSLPGHAPSPLQSPILNEVGTARLEEDEEGRRKVHWSHANMPGPE